MPHSSGGGSHGGGSHSGHSSGSHSSSHSGGSSGGSIDYSNTRLSRKPYRYCTTYCYYKDRKPVYIYSGYGAKDKESAGNIIGRIITWILVAPMFGILCIYLFMNSIVIPHKLDGKYDKKIIIDDRINVMSSSEEKQLRDTLKDFYKDTGIVPAVVTVHNEDWQTGDGEIVSFERVAYKEYLALFDDEKHWLIMYSEPRTPDGSFNDWYWEGMQGDDTDNILTAKKADAFTEDLHRRLLDEDITVGEAINGAFEKAGKGIMKVDINWAGIIFAMFPTGIFVFLSVYILNIHPIRKSILKKAFVVKDCKNGVPKEETCDHCGGIYVIGCHLSCPHCGGQLKAHDYTVDAEGNVVTVLK